MEICWRFGHVNSTSQRIFGKWFQKFTQEQSMMLSSQKLFFYRKNPALEYVLCMTCRCQTDERHFSRYCRLFLISCLIWMAWWAILWGSATAAQMNFYMKTCVKLDRNVIRGTFYRKYVIKWKYLDSVMKFVYLILFPGVVTGVCSYAQAKYNLKK